MSLLGLKFFRKAKFTSLNKDFENARICDYRNLKKPINKVLITCEHASNHLPKEYKWTPSDKKNFANEHWAYDIGAYNLAEAIAKDLELPFIYSLYSRLLCDVNRPATSDTIFRSSGNGLDIELNKTLPDIEQINRLNKYYLPYYTAFRKISMEIDPHYILSIHSFTPNYEGNVRKEEIGVLTSFSDELGDKFLTRFQQKGYKAFLNSPWSGKQGINYAIDKYFQNIEYHPTKHNDQLSLILGKYPIQREGIVIEFRNDLLTNEQTFKSISRDLKSIVKEVCSIQLLSKRVGLKVNQDVDKENGETFTRMLQINMFVK